MRTRNVGQQGAQGSPGSIGEHVDRLLVVGELADRWQVSVETAREYTRRDDFPQPLTFSSRTLRWDPVEVLTWEQAQRRTSRGRRRKPGKRAPETRLQTPRVVKGGQ